MSPVHELQFSCLCDVNEAFTLAGAFFLAPDADTSTSRCTFDVLAVRSVVKSLVFVTRTDRRLRDLDEIVGVRQLVLRQQ